MKAQYFSSLMGCLSLLAACTPQYTREKTQELLIDAQLKDQHQVTRESVWVLPQQAKLWLAYPQLSLADNSRRLNRTQYALAELLEAGFSRYFPATSQSLESQTLNDALADARRQGNDFLVFPEVLAISRSPTAIEEGSENAKTEQARLAMNLRVYDVRSRKLVDTLKVSSGQGWLDFSSREPKALMAEAIDKAVKRIVGN